MTVGIQFLREEDSMLLLADSRRNPILKAKSTVAAAAVPSRPYKRLIISYTNSNGLHPLLFFTSAGSYFLETVGKSGSTWTWSIGCDLAVGATAGYMIFDEDPVMTPTNVGLEIYADAPGLPILFNTSPATKPLRIVDVLYSASGVHSYDSGSTYAMAIGRYAGYLIYEDGARNASNISDPAWSALVGYARAMTVGASSLSFTDIRRDPATSVMPGTMTPPPSDQRDWLAVSCMVADVTGY